MIRKIDLLDGKYLYYDQGGIDTWCVFLVDENGSKTAPKDTEYFNELKDLAKIFGRNEVYNDYVKIYDITTNTIESEAVDEIKKIAIKYGEYEKEVFRIFATLYMAMISEQNKKNTKLGKRIKRLGVYFLLIKEETPEYCANFMRGKSWKLIDKWCQEGGF